jgi:hypothetical protein
LPRENCNILLAPVQNANGIVGEMEYGRDANDGDLCNGTWKIWILIDKPLKRGMKEQKCLRNREKGSLRGWQKGAIKPFFAGKSQGETDNCAWNKNIRRGRNVLIAVK